MLVVLFLYLVYNIFYAITAYPAGKISDYLGRNVVLAIGFFLFAITILGFGFFANETTLWFLLHHKEKIKRINLSMQNFKGYR